MIQWEVVVSSGRFGGRRLGDFRLSSKPDYHLNKLSSNIQPVGDIWPMEVLYPAHMAADLSQHCHLLSSKVALLKGCEHVKEEECEEAAPLLASTNTQGLPVAFCWQWRTLAGSCTCQNLLPLRIRLPYTGRCTVLYCFVIYLLGSKFSHVQWDWFTSEWWLNLETCGSLVNLCIQD